MRAIAYGPVLRFAPRMKKKTGRHVNRERSHFPLVAVLDGRVLNRRRGPFWFAAVRSSHVARRQRRYGHGPEVQIRFKRGPGQDDLGGVGEDHIPFAGFKSGNEAEGSFRPSDRVPGQPEAVGAPQRRFAFVVADIFRREHELLLRLDRSGIAIGVKGINGQSAVDFDRLFRVFAVKEKSTAKASHSRVARLIHDRVGPHRRHGFWALRFLLAVQPAYLLAHIQPVTAE